MRDKCEVCNDLDPRGHLASKLVKRAGIAKSTLELPCVYFWQWEKSKCRFCGLIVDAIKKMSPPTSWRDWPATPLSLEAITISEDEPILLTVRDRRSDGSKLRGIELFRSPEVEIPSFSTLGAAADIFDRPDLDDCFMFFKKWIQDCSKNHAACQETLQELPRRVLDLGFPCLNGDRAPIIKLLETNHQNQRYTALSHCWGESAEIFKTTEKNIRTLKNGVDLSSLPNTFQDAIIITRRLGIRYIWIDSLCIVQDDQDDLAIEAAKMHSIYRNAFITIAAASSSSGKESFLGQRPADFKSVPIRFRAPAPADQHPNRSLKFFGSTLSKLCARNRASVINARWTKRVSVQVGVNTWLPATDSTSSIFRGPLSERGWTLQERVLSTRIIHFTDEGIRWECLSQTHSEDLRTCPPSFMNQLSDIAQLSPREPARLRRLHGFWRYMLMEYTSRKLTFRSDLLPALGGIATRMHELHGSEYLAGLWRDHIIEDLCWWTITFRRVQRRHIQKNDHKSLNLDPNYKTLPTWSWISVPARIAYDVTDQRGVFTRHSSLLDSSCTLTSSNRFGQVRDGVLILEGPILEGMLSYILTDPPTAWFDCDGYTGQVKLDAPILEDGYTTEDGSLCATARRAIMGEEQKYLHIPAVFFDLGEWCPDEKISFYNSGGVDLSFTLVLVRSSRVFDAYERLGICDPVSVASRGTWENAEKRIVRLV